LYVPERIQIMAQNRIIFSPGLTISLLDETQRTLRSAAT